MAAPSRPLLPGMYVRFPLEKWPELKAASRVAGRFGNHAVAQILRGSDVASVLVVRAWPEIEKGGGRSMEAVLPLEALNRHFFLPQTPFRSLESGSLASVLQVANGGAPGTHARADYYCLRNGRLEITGEHHMCFAAHQAHEPVDHRLARFAPDPVVRMWRRGELAAQIAELDRATYGVREMVTARIILLAHQAEVVTRVLADPVCRFMLADEVGLGKTIEAGVVLQALHGSDPAMKTLIVAPAALARQWQSELRRKFRLDFRIVDKGDILLSLGSQTGVIVAYERLADTDWLRRSVLLQNWKMVIADEAHNLRRRPTVYETVHELSKRSERMLVLTATPVQRHAAEYLQLLRLMAPGHYDAMSAERFQQIVDKHTEIRRTIEFLERHMDPADFDLAEFVEEFSAIARAMPDDPALDAQLASVRGPESDPGLTAANALLTYVRANYRVENRVTRNRRANLKAELLPRRTLDLAFAYEPGRDERRVLESLHEYAARCMGALGNRSSAVEMCQLLFQAAASSPDALYLLLCIRLGRSNPDDWRDDPLALHFAQLCEKTHAFPGEASLLSPLSTFCKTWLDNSSRLLKSLPPTSKDFDKPLRIAQVVRIARQMMMSHKKVLIFSSFLPTIEEIWALLEKNWGSDSVAGFSARLDERMLEGEVNWFQGVRKCHVLVSDESGGEGRNFQIADAIIHVDIPWTPALIEQRIGRVDRLGRGGEVLSIVPLARATIEEQLFDLWHKGYDLFQNSTSGLEIALEQVQDEVARAFASSPLYGLAEVLPRLTEQATALREEVEEEFYFEEGAINWRKRREFEDLCKHYDNGTQLEAAVEQWLKHTNLRLATDPGTRISVIADKASDFAGLLRRASTITRNTPSNMPALTHAARDGKVRSGTFQRRLATLREDLAFFTPGEPCIDKILEQAIAGDRWRCAAVRRSCRVGRATWIGFELQFHIQVDPEPLFRVGYPPQHLRRVKGYLPEAMIPVFVDESGLVVQPDEELLQDLTHQPQPERDTDLSRETGQPSPISQFRHAHPPGAWSALIERVVRCGKEEMQSVIRGWHTDTVERARAELQRTLHGQSAALRWLHGEEHPITEAQIATMETIDQALLAGLAQPLCTLESICYWELV